MLNIPNLLSFFRILLVPLLVVVLLTKFEGKEFVGLAVFLIGAFTDFLDGFLARRHRQITRLGKLLDPAADKILTSAAFISLVEMNREAVPAWIVVALVSRELAVSALRSFASGEGILIPAAISGKVKTGVQIVSISLLILYSKLGAFRHLAPASLWLALAVSLYSGVEYFWRYGHLVRSREQRGGRLPETPTQPFPDKTRQALGLPPRERRHPREPS
jgi:CDP-diacylglycerol--glycerol-3-phosphate 3-phosphatidyltransferase